MSGLEEFSKEIWLPAFAGSFRCQSCGDSRVRVFDVLHTIAAVLLGGIEAVVENEAYVCAGRFTAADVSVGYALMLAELLDLAPKFPKAVLDYWQRLQDRDAFARALDAQQAAAIAQHVSVVPAPLVPW